MSVLSRLADGIYELGGGRSGGTVQKSLRILFVVGLHGVPFLRGRLMAEALELVNLGRARTEVLLGVVVGVK